MKTLRVLIVLLAAIMLLAGCAQPPDELDDAIREASDYLNRSLPEMTRIFFVNIQSTSDNLSDYIINYLMYNAGDEGVFSLTLPFDPDAVQAEFNFQPSGDVSDDTAVRVGRYLSAQTVVSGKVEKIGKNYRLTIRALDTQTAMIQGMFTRTIPAGKTIKTLIADKW